MKRLHFKVRIDAPQEKVWHAMLDNLTYRQWMGVFMLGSYFEGNWEEGSKMLFLAPDEKGVLGGLVSKIVSNKRYEYISIKHVGIMRNGVEDTRSEDVKSWAVAMENYTFKNEGGSTTLLVEVDANEDEVSFFEETWPKALQKLRTIAGK